jgi:predicted  nucleic acid-binding Zn-ribbon protein
MILNRTGDRFMGHIQRSIRHRIQALPKRKIKTRNEIEELREENRQLRELVAHLSKVALARITEAAEAGEQSASPEN